MKHGRPSKKDRKSSIKHGKSSMKKRIVTMKNIQPFMIFGKSSRKEGRLSIKYGSLSINYGKASVKHGKLSIEINRLSGHPAAAFGKEAIASERNKGQPIIVK